MHKSCVKASDIPDILVAGSPAVRAMRKAGRMALGRTIFLAFLSICSAAAADDAADTAAVLAHQADEYRAETAKTIIELQQFRRSEHASAEGRGGRRGAATLINLNPRINAWFLLTIDWEQPKQREIFHLENPYPVAQALELADSDPHGIRIVTSGRPLACDLWWGNPATQLEAATRTLAPYAPLCGSRLYLRNRVSGHHTSLEEVTDLLRDHVWGGEAIIRFVKREFYRDTFLEQGRPSAPSAPIGSADPAWPRQATLDPAHLADSITPANLAIDLGKDTRTLTAGRWYPVNGLAGIYVSVIEPQIVAPEILKSYRDIVNALDGVEAGALDYLVAFDLAAFDVGFSLGTDHPRVGWSDRVSSGSRGGDLPGPDGIDSTTPLITNGVIGPWLVGGTVASFTGGFKRQHGAFRYGALAGLNHGSHYGFIEQGALFSKLQPGLSTLFVLDDGSVDIKTWTASDDDLLPRIRSARQNGVPLIDYDPATGLPAPGSLVARWGPGNWSGSADENLRTLRAGACLQQTPSRRFLIYGYFSTATPSAMARVFQAYGCRYAMHLDMNALEHTYLALYVHSGDQLVVQHLVSGMADVDQNSDGAMMPRFLAFPDDRDFFYLTRRERPR